MKKLVEVDLQKGDVIKCQGITCTIDTIAFQEPWSYRDSYYLEFTDTDGVYRSWKQKYDGGDAYRKEEDNSVRMREFAEKFASVIADNLSRDEMDEIVRDLDMTEKEIEYFGWDKCNEQEADEFINWLNSEEEE